MDKELTKIIKDGIKIGNSISQSLEQLVEISSQPLIQIETVPPRCPFCGQINPKITVEPTEGEGNIEEFVMEAQCGHCNREIYAVPSQWVILENASEAKIQIEQNQERVNFGRASNTQ